MDWMEQEQERGITITSTPLHAVERLPRKYHRYTRTTVDFYNRSSTFSTRIDGAVTVLDAQSGVNLKLKLFGGRN